MTTKGSSKAAQWLEKNSCSPLPTFLPALATWELHCKEGRQLWLKGCQAGCDSCRAILHTKARITRFNVWGRNHIAGPRTFFVLLYYPPASIRLCFFTLCFVLPVSLFNTRSSYLSALAACTIPLAHPPCHTPSQCRSQVQPPLQVR